ncbi:mutT/nudix family protein [Pseudomonas sp. M47T1]|nr:mutT/nudix family protein [Pseudomonas sp. M47T1]
MRATVIYRRDDEILFVRKRKSKWNLPGGRVERGESPMQAALREMEEETGLAFNTLSFVSKYQQNQVVHFLFEARRTLTRKPRPRNEIDACRWVSMKQLWKRNVRGPIRSLLKRCASDLDQKITLH